MHWTHSKDLPDGPRERPFSPPPAPATSLWTQGVIFGVAVLALLAFFDFFDFSGVRQSLDRALKPPHSFTVRPAENPALPAAPIAPQRPAPAALSALQSDQQVDSASAPPIVKCVVNGKTSYGDGPCAQGAVSSQLKTHRDHNLMAAVRPQAVDLAPTPPNLPAPAAPPAAAPPAVVAPSRPVTPSAAARQAECQHLDATIRQLDAASRQPQSAQSQDWIRSQRQDARDRQFRLSCT